MRPSWDLYVSLYFPEIVKNESERVADRLVCVSVCVFMTKTPALCLEVIISSRLHSTGPSLWCNWSFFFCVMVQDFLWDSGDFSNVTFYSFYSLNLLLYSLHLLYTHMSFGTISFFFLSTKSKVNQSVKYAPYCSMCNFSDRKGFFTLCLHS